VAPTADTIAHGRCVTRAMRGAQEKLAEGVENFTLDSVEFERTMNAAVQVRKCHAFETNHKRRRHLAAPAHPEANGAAASAAVKNKAGMGTATKAPLYTLWDRRRCARLRKSCATGVGRSIYEFAAAADEAASVRCSHAYTSVNESRQASGACSASSLRSCTP